MTHPRHAPGVLLLALLLLALLLGACGGAPPSAPADTGTGSPSPRAWLQIQNLRTYVYNAGRLETTLNAQAAAIDMDEKVLVLQRVQAGMFDADRKLTGSLAGRRGRLYLADRPADRIFRHDLYLYDGVLLETPAGLLCRTPGLWYLSQQGEIASRGGPFERRIPYGGGTMISTGMRFTANKDLTQFTDYENVRVRMVSGDAATTRTAAAPTAPEGGKS